MTWHTATAARQALPSLLARIRSAGGTIEWCKPVADGVHVTWTTLLDRAEGSSTTAPR